MKELAKLKATEKQLVDLLQLIKVEDSTSTYILFSNWFFDLNTTYTIILDFNLTVWTFYLIILF